MKFLINEEVDKKGEGSQVRRFTFIQYIGAIAAMILSVSAITYAATTFTVFGSGTISAQQMNDNFTNIKETLAALDAAIKSNTPVGTLVMYSGTTAPAGYKICPTNLADATVNISDFPALYAAVGSTWGVGTSNTFVMPWFPEGYALTQANLNVGVHSVGEVISHTHSLAPASYGQGGGGDGGQRLIANGAGGWATGAAGGSANLAAGARVLILVKI